MTDAIKEAMDYATKYIKVAMERHLGDPATRETRERVALVFQRDIVLRAAIERINIKNGPVRFVDRQCFSRSVRGNYRKGKHASRMARRWDPRNRRYKKWIKVVARCGLLIRTQCDIVVSWPVEKIVVTFKVDKSPSDIFGVPYDPDKGAIIHFDEIQPQPASGGVIENANAFLKENA